VNAISSVDPSEVEKFAALAAQWWEPNGPFAPLHKFNPVRLAFIRDVTLRHFQRDKRSLRPFDGLSLLDLGCGGGLLAEPMARLGFAVTGIDAAEENIRAAAAHAATSDVQVTYRCATAEDLITGSHNFDVVLNMEVVEHVPDPAAFLGVASELVRPGGLMIVATINRTLKSLALAKIGAEYIIRWLPAGTHDWNRFLSPEMLKRFLERAGLEVVREQGIGFDPRKWTWQLSGDLGVNYMVVARRAKRGRIVENPRAMLSGISAG
jgi:2-polyprenyl-6-hydroxyphenyl methylase/3-demethylubiquinone-9 3-methyltransferase